jgi:hypothetical protein
MSYYIFDIRVITSEQEATDAAMWLVDEAIIATTAIRGKQKKIRVTESKITQLQRKCTHMKWEAPLGRLKTSLEALEAAKAEDDLSLWRI